MRINPINFTGGKLKFRNVMLDTDNITAHKESSIGITWVYLKGHNRCIGFEVEDDTFREALHKARETGQTVDVFEMRDNKRVWS